MQSFYSLEFNILFFPSIIILYYSKQIRQPLKKGSKPFFLLSFLLPPFFFFLKAGKSGSHLVHFLSQFTDFIHWGRDCFASCPLKECKRQVRSVFLKAQKKVLFCKGDQHLPCTESSLAGENVTTHVGKGSGLEPLLHSEVFSKIIPLRHSRDCPD